MKLRRNMRKYLLMLIDTCLIVISLFIAVNLRFEFSIPAKWSNVFINLLPFSILTQLLVFNVSGFYRSFWRFSSIWDLLNILKLVTISFLISLAILFLFTDLMVSRSVLILFYLFCIFSLSSVRISVRIYHSHYNKFFGDFEKIKNNKKIILIGAGTTGEKIAREVINSSMSPYEIIGFVDDNPDLLYGTIHGISVLGSIRNMKNLRIDFQELLITAPSATGDQMRVIVEQCKLTGKKYRTVPTLAELINKDVSIDAIRDVSYADLLGRDEVFLDVNSIEKFINGKRILISGAGGSIGSELLKQSLAYNPAEVICVDFNEESIFNIGTEAKKSRTRTIIKPVLCNILHKQHLEKIFNENRPQIILHAAAYKHVPIQEIHPWMAVETNIGGTLNLIEMANKYNSEKFVLVSTDKAVNPVNVMGATKRLAEKLIQSFDSESKTQFLAVRFGNVLGSSGSAVPIFQKQIKEGGPVTITHPEMKRYFMSIPEAAQLILQASSLGQKGNIFLLDMGKPIKIDNMARDLIKLSGFEPDIDIPIVYTGLRPGEKLYEELQSIGENIVKTNHTKILILKDGKVPIPWKTLRSSIELLLQASKDLKSDSIQVKLKELLPTYKPRKFQSLMVNHTTIPFKIIEGEA